MQRLASRLFRRFEGFLDPYPPVTPAPPPRGVPAFCLHYARGAWRWLLLMAACSTAIALAEVWLYGAMGALIDRMGAAGPEAFLAREWRWLLLVGVIVLVVIPLVDLVSQLVTHQTLIGNFPQRIRWLAHRYLLRQSMRYFQDEFAGRIATRLMQTALAVREVLMKLLDVSVYVLAYFLGAVVLALSNDWRLAVPFLVWGLAYGLLLWRLVPVLGHIAQAQADARSEMTGRIVDSYTNIATVKLFSHAQREEGYARDSMDGFLDTVHRQMRLITVLNISLQMLNAALLAGVTGLGLWLWQHGLIEVGALAAALPLAMRFGAMSHWIMWEMSALFENIGTVKDGAGSLAIPHVVADAPDARPLLPGPGAVRFESVRFGYGGTGPVIDDLTLNIAPGERIGLIGRSGAGKSTLVNLLLRFHDVEGGRILIDGQDIAQVTQDSLRAAIGVVTQDTSLLHRSVRDNIAYGRPDAGLAEIAQAAAMAEAADFIPTLADASGRQGYDAHVGERGVKLSGGQRQRIAIARVVLKDAPILVLDEATSALDSEVEAAIQGQLDRLMQGKTVIAIAHRLSTIAAMDRLVVLESGRIVEMGRHADLLAHGGLYARLWARQSGGFLGEGPDQADG